jgi:hypothetical protein
MFAPKVAKAQTKAAESPTSKLVPQRSTLEGHRLGNDPVERLSLKDHSETDLDERKATAAVSWDFSKIPIFPPDRAYRPKPSSPLSATPLPGGMQAKLAVGQANDPLEHEADRIACQVMRMPEAPLAELNLNPAGAAEETTDAKSLRRSQPSALESAGEEAPAMVHDVLRSPGRRLDATTRAFMESHFRHDFSEVRVHSDAEAATSTQQVNALAYTAGHHVVFGRGRYAPQTRDGKQLLAHELAHVVQQSRTGSSAMPTRIMRQTPGSSPQPAQQSPATSVVPPTRSFKQLWEDFDKARQGSKNAEAMALVDEILAIMIGEDSMAHAGDLALWLLDQGEQKKAMTALESLEAAWWVRWVSISGPGLKQAGWPKTIGPVELIDRGEAEAAAGRHDTARELLGTAYLFLQMQYKSSTDERIRSVQQTLDRLPPNQDLPLIRILAYSEIGGLVAQMRRILAIYPGRERAALAAANQAQAATEADLGKQLRDRIREQYLLTGQSGLTLEASQITSPKMGTGYKLHGANQGEVDVFPLPGTPRPDELGKHPVYTAPMETVFETISGQEEFNTDLLRNPEIRSAFGTKRIEMTDLATRLKVWRIMYAVFQRSPMAGCPDALCSVLRLMKRYLHDFTTHTEYNIPDFGTYYIITEEKGGFPTDLLGRTMRDCGVYALTVAYELFRTARGASPKMNVGFQLYQTLEHVMLAILDHDNNKHYVVNNDDISGPTDGLNPLGSVALSYSQTMNRKMVVTPAARTDLGDTKQTEAEFRTRSWERYQAGATLGLQTEPPAGPDDTRTDAERKEATYTKFYREQEQLEQLGVQLHADLDALLMDVTAAAANQRASLLASRLPNLTAEGLTLGRIFGRALDPKRVGVSSPKDSKLLTPVGLFTTGRINAPHPLVRLAKVFLFYQNSGGTLTTDQQSFISLVQAGVVPEWATELKSYVAAGTPASW